jgi:hypothetical protein
MIGGTTTHIAAAVALGCALAVPGASFATGDKDESATSKATVQYKKLKKGWADTALQLPKYTGGQAR